MRTPPQQQVQAVWPVDLHRAISTLIYESSGWCDSERDAEELAGTILATVCFFGEQKGDKQS